MAIPPVDNFYLVFVVSHTSDNLKIESLTKFSIKDFFLDEAFLNVSILNLKSILDMEFNNSYQIHNA